MEKQNADKDELKIVLNLLEDFLDIEYAKFPENSVPDSFKEYKKNKIKNKNRIGFQ